jgi:hypothetical protein
MLEITETRYTQRKLSRRDDREDDLVIENREPRWIRPFTNEDDGEEDVSPDDRYIPNVLVDEIEDEDKRESDPDDPCMTLEEINSRRHRYSNP